MPNHYSPTRSLSNDQCLYHLLLKQKKIYQAVLDLTLHEHLVLQQQNTSVKPVDIRPLLAKKKSYIQSINDLENALHPLKKNWQQRNDSSTPLGQSIERELHELNSLIKEILQLDLKSQKQLEQYILRLKGKLEPAHRDDHE